MRARHIESMDKWFILKQAIIDQGYRLFTMQYSWDQPEGFIATFFKDYKDVEVITHIEEIQRDIIDSNLC